jgi:hypothetical protein
MKLAHVPKNGCIIIEHILLPPARVCMLLDELMQLLQRIRWTTRHVGTSHVTALRNLENILSQPPKFETVFCEANQGPFRRCISGVEVMPKLFPTSYCSREYLMR